MPRIYCPAPLHSGQPLALPPGPARHVQVLRLQPGTALTLYNGEGGEYDAIVEQMGRSDVTVRVGEHRAIEREAPVDVHLAIGMPANERMDWLVEKATELGVVGIQPLVAERSVLKLNSERAQKKRAHWQGIAVAACEQCGRNRVPVVHEAADLGRWLSGSHTQDVRLVLSLSAQARPWAEAISQCASVLVLSGPEGGLSPSEEHAALAQGFLPASLGARVLRAETAPLALLAALSLR